MSSVIHSVTTLGCLIKVMGIDTGNRRDHHAKIEMIGHSVWVQGLTFRAADILFNFLEARFDIPLNTIILDDLFIREIGVCYKQSNPL